MTFLLDTNVVSDVLNRGMSVAIGVEHGVQPLSSCSVVVAPVVVDGEHRGSVGVPVRVPQFGQNAHFASCAQHPASASLHSWC